MSKPMVEPAAAHRHGDIRRRVIPDVLVAADPGVAGQFLPARRVCVLTGTTGVTVALQRFLSRLPAQPGVSFLVALHTDGETARRLVELLKRTSVLPIRQADDPQTLMHDEALVIALEARQREARPVDRLLQAVARQYQTNAGAIVFSGNGDDGVVGCHSIIRHGGTVWAQDAASAHYSSLPNHVRQSCRVALSANPEAMADRLMHELRLLDQPGQQRRSGRTVVRAPRSVAEVTP
ncbi:MAG: chemotaxis protein CheB [Gammaproteobacteria bacterium]|nr:chemotaxis protein CheB [Gammaproteobacteria bacterium]